MSHTCHAAGCSVHTPPQMLMCKRHWFMVPREIRNRVWSTYRDGQCDDWDITNAYANAARAAVRAVAERENRTEAEIAKACRVYDVLEPKDGA